MESSGPSKLRIGLWCATPRTGEISRDGKTIRLDTRAMRLLVCLAEHAGEVVSIDDLLNEVWQGVTVSQDSVYQAVASLRRELGDDSKSPTYIETVPRLGYRMLATVGPWQDGLIPNGPGEVKALGPNGGHTSRRYKPGSVVIITAVLCLALAFILISVFRSKVASSGKPTASADVSVPQNSIAVLPFLDLTEGMHEETFADGMTEELIDKFSKIPGLRVPAPTSSFYFKGKQIPVAEIARSMGVAYVLDGSVRKSGGRLRVAARLVRAENGYVVWADTYDRPFGDILMIQDDIAGEVTKALKAAIGNQTGAGQH
jgi:transcriptional activator of cad operon